MRKTLLIVSLILASTGCGVKRHQPQINLFITPPAQTPYVDLHDKFVKNYI